MENTLLKSILDDGFLETLAKSADLYKIGSNSVLDPEEIRIGLKVVPRAVMAMLVSELVPMEINSHKDIKLPFGKYAYVSANKNAADDFTGSVYDNNKLVYDFKNRSIPGLGIILLSTFELYDMEELNKPHKHEEDIDRKVQKLIDERMELHSLVNRVVEDKMAQREAIHKIMMNKLNEAMKAPVLPAISPAKMAEPAIVAPKAIEINPEDITKKEAPMKKGSPLKAFLERKKKPKEYLVQKCETTDCADCGQTIFGASGYSGCICYGENQNSKLFLNKNEKGELSIRFSRNWSPENIEMLLDALRKNNGKY